MNAEDSRTAAEYGSIYFRRMDSGDAIAVYPMTFGKARVCLIDAAHGQVANAFCYGSRTQAIAAAEVWNGEGDAPDGWHRHPETGRRRDGGDHAKEVVRW